MTQVQTERRVAREYELIYILNPNTSPDEAERISNRIQDVVARLGGKITKVDQWGRRKLAYPIKKLTRGVFVFVKIVAFNDLVAEIERNLRNADAVIRFQTIRKEAVELASVEVNPDEAKFTRIEAPAEDEAEPTLEERLGLVQKPREPREEDFQSYEDPANIDDDDIPDLGGNN